MHSIDPPAGGERRSGRTLRAGAAAAALIAGGLLATGASAGCGDAPKLKPAAFQVGDAGYRLVQAGLPNLGALTGFAPIVGMWSVTYIDSAGGLNDFGYQQWHSDGTEILNSGTHSPATENFCLGVWKESLRGHFLLNHFALSYAPGANTPAVKINIKEDVTVDPSGDTFKGVFSQDVYDFASGAAQAHITGTVTGKRVKVDS